MGFNQFMSKLKVKRSIKKFQKELLKELSNGISYDFLHKIFTHTINIFGTERTNNTFMIFNDYFNGIQITVSIISDIGVDRFGLVFEEYEHISALKYIKHNVGIHADADKSIMVTDEITRHDATTRKKEEQTYLFSNQISLKDIKYKDFITTSVSTNIQLLEYRVDRYLRYLIDWIKEKSMVRL